MPQRVKQAKPRRVCRPTQADQNEAHAARVERREHKRTRKRDMLELARKIYALHDTGSTVDEIGAALGSSPSCVRHFAAVRGVLLSRSCGKARDAVTVTVSNRDMLAQLAADYGGAQSRRLRIY